MAVKQSEWTVVAMLEWATGYLQEKGVSDARFSIEWLLADLLGMKRLDLYLYFDRPLSKDELNRLRPLVKRRAKQEPLQYITGRTDFLNTTLTVNSTVLIPRPETEQLVEIALKNHSQEKQLSVLDIGTGSGCIAIALKTERPDWNVTALDISADALTVAKENAENNNAAIRFLEYDILSAGKNDFQNRFDVIISNPPYVLSEEKEMLESQVIKYEPATALFCENIEQMYQKIIEFGDENLASGGSLFLEIHAGQKAKIMPLFNSGWKVKLIKDYSGKERFIHANKMAK